MTVSHPEVKSRDFLWDLPRHSDLAARHNYFAASSWTTRYNQQIGLSACCKG